MSCPTLPRIVLSCSLWWMAGPVACTDSDDPLPPTPVGMSGGGQSAGQGSGADGGSADDDAGGDDTGTDECDPYAGCHGADCSFVDRQCYGPAGNVGPGGACVITISDLQLDDCQPELWCAFAGTDPGRCVRPCNTSMTSNCASDETCALGLYAGPRGICVAQCALLLQECPRLDDGCYTYFDDRLQRSAACLPAGSFWEGEACSADSECLPGMLCLDAGLHPSGCPEGSDACCTALCDVDFPNCLASECNDLDVMDQGGVGYCPFGS